MNARKFTGYPKFSFVLFQMPCDYAMISDIVLLFVICVLILLLFLDLLKEKGRGTLHSFFFNFELNFV